MSATLSLFDATGREALISRDGLYRYRLSRSWDAKKPRVVFVMLNPSTADATQDDPTIRKCIGFAKRWGMGEIVVVNLFAWRATDPRELYRAPPSVDIIGPDNDEQIVAETHCPNGHDDNDEPINPPALVVAAWGIHGALNGRDADALELFAAHGIDASCLGTTKEGHPRHPLMVAYDTPLVPFIRRERGE